MRLPLPVVIGIALLSVGLLWWLRTKDMDFLTPKGVAIPSEYSTDPAEAPENPVNPPEEPSPPPPPVKPDLDLGDVESSPGLAEYSEFAPKGAGHLITLATELETQGHIPRSLLAWERVIDSCHPSPQERATAEEAIVRIRPTLTYWNIDPAGDLPLLLQLGSSRRTSDNLKEAAQKAAEFLRRDSDHTLLIEPRLTTSRVRNAPANSPVAIYFSGAGKREAQLRSFTPQNDEVEHYLLLILTDAYKLVRQELINAGGILPPQTGNHLGDPKIDFQRQVTRLHWKRFAESLNRSGASDQ